MPSISEVATEFIDLTLLIKLLKKKLHEISCVIWNGGHELYRETNDTCIYQRCVSCGYKSKGWTIDRRDRGF